MVIKQDHCLPHSWLKQMLALALTQQLHGEKANNLTS